jgi:hypothetical protein
LNSLRRFAVESAPSLSAVVRKLCFFTLMGFLALILLGPVIAVVATLLSLVLTVLLLVLPFAVIGYLVWIPYQVLSRDKQAAWNNIRDAGLAFHQALVVVPAGICAQVCRGGARIGRFALEKTRRLKKFLAGIATETVCGTLVGGVVGMVGSLIHQDNPLEWRVPVGFLLGAIIGALIGLVWTKPAKQPVAVQVARR